MCTVPGGSPLDQHLFGIVFHALLLCFIGGTSAIDLDNRAPELHHSLIQYLQSKEAIHLTCFWIIIHKPTLRVCLGAESSGIFPVLQVAGWYCFILIMTQVTSAHGIITVPMGILAIY
jgi:hypothetical protein